MTNLLRTLDVLNEKKAEDVVDVLQDHLHLSRQQLREIDTALVKCRSEKDTAGIVIRVLAQECSLTRLREVIREIHVRSGVSVRTGDVLNAVVHDQEDPKDVQEVEKHVIKIFGRDWRTLR